MTHDEIIVEMRHTERDLAAFRTAMDSTADRKMELEGDPDRQRMFMEWPATQAALNVMIMAITRCEGIIEDYRTLLETADVPDNVVTLERNHE